MKYIVELLQHDHMHSLISKSYLSMAASANSVLCVVVRKRNLKLKGSYPLNTQLLHALHVHVAFTHCQVARLHYFDLSNYYGISSMSLSMALCRFIVYSYSIVYPALYQICGQFFWLRTSSTITILLILKTDELIFCGSYVYT